MSLTLSILHAADMHLGRSFTGDDSFPPARAQDLLHTFGRICALAVDRHVDVLVIAGDLFDTYNPSPSAVGRAHHELDRVRGAGIPVCVIPGNHDDVWYPGSIWRRDNLGTVLFDQATFTAHRFQVRGTAVHIHGVAYNHAICADPVSLLQRDGDGVHVAIVHATVDPPTHYPVQRRYYPLSSEALLASRMDYVALGHIHRQHEFRQGLGTYACYPGSPEGLDPTETGDRYAALIDFDGAIPSVELLQVNERAVTARLLDVTASTNDDIIQQIRAQADPNLLLRVTLTGTPDEVPDIEKLHAHLAAGFFWLGFKDETEMMGALWVESLAQQHTIAGTFVRTLQERIELSVDSDERTKLELALKLGLVALRRRSAA